MKAIQTIFKLAVTLLAVFAVIVGIFLLVPEDQPEGSLFTDDSSTVTVSSREDYEPRSLEYISFDAASLLADFVDTQQSYYAINDSYTDQCDQLQSYSPEFDQLYHSGDREEHGVDLCYQLQLKDDQQTLIGLISFGYLDDNPIQRFTYRLKDGVDFQPVSCAALISVGCQRGQWSSIGPSTER